MTGIICAMQIEADGIIALSQNTQTEENRRNEIHHRYS